MAEEDDGRGAERGAERMPDFTWEVWIGPSTAMHQQIHARQTSIRTAVIALEVSLDRERAETALK
jgi:hypothetical protein